jgi:hypothetical protein
LKVLLIHHLEAIVDALQAYEVSGSVAVARAFDERRDHVSHEGDVRPPCRPTTRIAAGAAARAIPQVGEMDIPLRNRYSAFAMGARSAKKELRAARAQLYHRLICGAAERVFATYGFARARVEEIARISGVSIGTIYRIFPGRKRAIYNATIEGRSSELVETTRAAGLAAAQQGRNLVDAWLVSIGVLVEYRNDGIGDARWLREADGSGDRSCCGA